MAEQIYGGDLLGNLWRFDISDEKRCLRLAGLRERYNGGAPANGRSSCSPSSRIRRNTAAHHHRAADRDRPQQRHRPLRVHRHGQAARYQRPHQPGDAAGADDVLVPRRHAGSHEDPGLPIKPRVTMKPQCGRRQRHRLEARPNGWYHDLPSTSPTAERIVRRSRPTSTSWRTSAPRSRPTRANCPCRPRCMRATSPPAVRCSRRPGVVASITACRRCGGGLLVGRTDPAPARNRWAGSFPGKSRVAAVRHHQPGHGPGNRLSWRLLTGQ